MALYHVSGKGRILRELDRIEPANVVQLSIPQRDGSWIDKCMSAQDALKVVKGLQTFKQIQFSFMTF